MMRKVIECKNLNHFYGEKQVLKDLNFSLQDGVILGLLGKNGTGKTTTINILTSFLEQTSGECLIYDEDTRSLSPAVKARIGYLLEGHIQYSFMNIEQIEAYYSQFYPFWKKEGFYELMKKMDITPRQRIRTMSCGQQSQVALGLLLAQDPDLLILDDFSMGLDPGYRRLFIDYLREYAKAEKKTIFTTSHIIQDMERLIDEVMILDRNEKVMQQSLFDFMHGLRLFCFNVDREDIDWSDAPADRVDQIRNRVDCYTWKSELVVRSYLDANSIQYSNFKRIPMSLEDAFIGLTGKY